MVISTDTVAILDPHKRFVKEDYEPELAHFLSHSGHAACFDGVFGLTPLTTSYNATLFRFPLRKTNSQSEIVQGEYSPDRVKGFLYNSFINEAPVIMLFLKYVQEISLYDNDKLIYKVSIDQSQVSAIERERQALLKLAERTSLSCSLRVYSMSIQTQDQRMSHYEPLSWYHWLVINMIGSSDKKIIAMSKDQNNIPWVGVAAPLPHQTNINLSLRNCTTSDIVACITELKKGILHSPLSLPWCDSARGHLDGQVFCFLPLPGTTNLPVNIHGYFSVSDNRRTIEWPAADNKSAKALWNEALLKSHIAPLYSILLALRSSLLRYANTPLPLVESENSDITDPYAAWPLFSKVKFHHIWRDLVAPTLDGVAGLPILWTAAEGGIWVKLQDAFYLPAAPTFPIPKTVIELLVRVNVPIVSLPTEIRETLTECGLRDILNHKVLSPALIRYFLKQLSQGSLGLNDKEKVQDVLECILYDIDNSNCTELVGLSLLPVYERKFKTVYFKETIRSESERLYLVDQNEALEFLPNIEGSLVHQGLRRSIFSKLHSLAKRRNLQLSPFTPDAIISHLLPLSILSWYPKLHKSSSPVQWTPGQNNHPPQEWITHVWNWLNRNCASLSELEGLPLIPTIKLNKHFNNISLLCLPKSSTGSFFFNKEADDDEIQLADLLLKMRATVVKHNQFVFTHQEIKKYIFKINIQTVLQYIGKIGVQATSSLLTENDKVLLRSSIVNFYKSRGISFADLIKKLPIFEAGVGANPRQLVSVNQGYILPHPRIDFKDDLHYPPNFFNNADYDVCVLLQKLGCSVLGLDDILIKCVMPFALQQCRNSPHRWCNGDELFLFILNHVRSYGALSNIAFVRTQADMKVLKCPGELYDISDEQFTKIFEAQLEPFFPHQNYYDKGVSEKLQQTGLVTWKKLVKDAYKLTSLMKERASAVRRISNQSVAIDRSCFLIEVITSVPAGLSHKIMAELSTVPFLAVQVLQPDQYPRCLQWFGARKKRDLFEAPCNVHMYDANPYLIGAVAPILSSAYFKQNMNSIRPFTMSVTINDVIAQLNILVSSVKLPLSTSEEVTSITSCVCSIYNYLNNHSSSISKHDLPAKWIWWQNEGGLYTFVDSIFFVWHSIISLSPFIHSLMQNPQYALYRNLFIKSGGIQESPAIDEIAGVLHRIASTFSQLDEKYLEMVINIILYLKSKSFSGNVYLPTTDCLILPAKDCTYDDREWIRKRVGAGISKYKFVHEKIPPVAAKYFGVEPLSKKVAPSMGLELTYTKAGQSERVTRRIGGIVRDYSGNIDVFKELIQNADDAGASKVKLLIDWRHHGTESVIAEEMSQWQGPALIAYNNATFSDQDFKNICELAAESKMKDPMKTGRFGVGFCACYSLTDVPSFVSRHSITIFDPHTKYLGDRVTHNEPGMRINLVENREDLTVYKDQFVPFDGLFGCHIFELTGEGFDGTLFRFPMRMDSFPKSEICNDHYDEYHIDSLIKELRREANNILLFLKNVQSLEFYVIPKTAKSPSEMKLQFKIEKESKEHSARLQIIRDPHYVTNPLCSLVTINFQDDSGSSKSQLLVATALAKTALPNSKPGLLPLAELAIPISPDSCCPLKLKDNGSLFCFLPLPLKSYVPFHINGFFDIGKDRRGLKEATQSLEFQWNEGLITAVLPFALESALAKLAKQLKTLSSETLKQYYSLWPGDYSSSDDRRNWLSGVFSTAAMNVLINSKEKLMWSTANGGLWVTPRESYLFINDARLPKEIESEAMTLIKSEGYPLIECPPHVVKSLTTMLASNNHILSYQWFFTTVFLPNINSISEPIRTNQIMFVLQKIKEEQHMYFNKKYSWAISPLKDTACISVSSLSRLAKPCDLIDTSCKPMAQLYDETEGFFPDKKFHKVSDILNMLGMISQELPLDMLAERARTVSILDKQAAEGRMMSLLFYIHYVENRDIQHRYMYSQKETELKKREERINVLKDIPFLLSVPKPDSASVPWNCNTKNFLPPSQLYSPAHSCLVFASVPLVNIPIASDSNIEIDKMVNYLGINKNEPTLNVVLDHLCELIQHLNLPSLDESTLQYIEKEKVFFKIYNFIQIAQKPLSSLSIKDTAIERLQNKKCIWQKGKLLYPKQVVCDWNVEECLPYVVPLSDTNVHFKELFVILGVQVGPSIEYLFSLLAQINEDFFETPLKEDVLHLTIQIAERLYSLSPSSSDFPVNRVLLPNDKGILCPVSKLSCDPFVDSDSEWISQLSDYQDFVLIGGRPIYPKIPRETALRLGARPLLDTIVKHIEDENFLDDTDFGQSEDLVDRLNGILKKYPADTSIFREYIQNADDAKATEIVFVLDHRSKHPQEKLLTEGTEWASLQRVPALCIYNNRQFMEEDIKGICKLGRGGKGDTADTIGRFGIGFNVSYHLTDCPTFVSFDSHGHPKDLCVFDPLKKYCNKKKGNPGRRWKVNQRHMNQFPDQFKPFLVDEMEQMKVMADCFEDKSSGFVVFRLPLIRDKPLGFIPMSNTRWLMEGRAHDVHQVIQLLNDFKAASKDMLLFLNNIKNISVFEIKADGNCVHHFSSNATVKNEPKGTFLKFGSTLIQTVVTHQVNLAKEDDQETVTKWLISKRSGFHQSSYELSEICTRASERGLEPFGGVATTLDAESLLNNGSLFCFLPMNIPSCLPVHLNAHFLVDDSRRHLESLPGLEKWNSSIAEHLLLPAYIDLLLEARKEVDGSEKSIKWFYSLFPNISDSSSLQTSEASPLNLNVLLYSKLLQENCPVLLDASGLKNGDIKWLNMNIGQFCIDRTFSHENKLVVGAKELEPVFVSLDLPITRAPAYLFRSFVRINSGYIKTGLLTPNKVLNHVKTIDRKLYENTLKEKCQGLLSFCTQHRRSDEIHECLKGAPLLLTLAGTLNFTGKLFESKFSVLLPHQKELFVSPSMEAKLLQDGRFGNVIVPLPVNHVSSSINLSKVSSPMKLSDDEVQLVKHLWNYLIHMNSFLFPSYVSIDQFQHMPILPATSGFYYPPILGKCLFNQGVGSNSHVLTAMLKLGYETIYFSQVGQALAPHFVNSYISSSSSCSDIIQCLNLRPPNLNVSFNEEEVTHIISVLSQADEISDKIIAILKQLPIFETVNKTYIKVSSAKFHIKPLLVPSAGIITIQQTINQLVLANPSSQADTLYKKIFKGDYESAQAGGECGFYLNYLIPHFSYLTESELEVHLDFIKRSYFYSSSHFLTLQIKEWQPVIAALKKTPLLMRQQDGSGGIRQLVSKFCDPNIKFNVVFQESLLPPMKWRSDEWLPFLRELGLQSKVSTSVWLDKARKFSKEIEKINKRAKPPDSIMDKSTVLIASLENIISSINSFYFGYQEKEGSDKIELPEEISRFLAEASKIQFIYCPEPCKLVAHIETITGESPVQHQYFISFHEAVFYRSANKTCLVRKVLPASCQFLQNFHFKINNKLSIREPINLKAVVKNLVALSEALSTVKVFIPSLESTRAIRRVKEIIESHYSFMESNLDEKMIRELTEVSCVLLTTSQLTYQLVKPSQLVIDLPNKSDFHPFCYGTPIELMRYSKLLNVLGIKKKLEPTQYISILKAIKNELKHGKLTEDKQFEKVCQSAYIALVKDLRLLQEMPIFSKDVVIYLPSDGQELVASTELVHNDVPWVASRLKKSSQLLKYKFLHPPPPDDRGQMAPPSCLRVKLLSNLAVEKLSTFTTDRLNKCSDQELFENKKHKTNCKAVQILEDTIHSHDFTRGIGRLYWHQHQKHPKKDAQFCLQLLSLSKCEIHCVKDITTIIHLEGSAMKNTEDSSRLCYIVTTGHQPPEQKQGEKQGQEKQSVQLYISHKGAMNEDKLFEELAKEIGHHLLHSTGDTVNIKEMFRCFPHQISMVLDKLKISPFNLQSSGDGTDLSSSDQDVGCLIYDHTFSKEEFIIFCNYDKDEKVIFHYLENGKECFVYAKVVDYTPKTESRLSDMCIKVCIGNTDKGDPIIKKASLFQVYKLLDMPQKNYLENGSSSPYVSPLIISPVPQTEEKLEKWMRDTLVYNGKNSCCSAKQLSMRLTGHLHYVLVRNNKGPELFVQASKTILDIISEEDIALGSTIQAVEDLVKKLESLSIHDDSIAGEPQTPPLTATIPTNFLYMQGSARISTSLPRRQLFNRSPNTQRQPTVPQPTSSIPVYRINPPGGSGYSIGGSGYSGGGSGYNGGRGGVSGIRIIGNSNPFVTRTLLPETTIQPQQPQTDKNKAKMWLQQCKADYLAAITAWTSGENLLENQEEEEEKEKLEEKDKNLVDDKQEKEEEEDQEEEEVNEEEEGKVKEKERKEGKEYGEGEEEDEEDDYEDDKDEKEEKEEDLIKEKEEKEEDEEDEEDDDEDDKDEKEEEEDLVKRKVATQHKETCRFPALICFLCHDVVEKCLKGLMYARCGLPEFLINDSCLTKISTEIQKSPHIQKRIKDIVKECVLQVSEHDNRSRYPHYQIPPCAPASVYSSLEAMEALRATRKLINKIREDDELKELLGDIDDLPEKMFDVLVPVSGNSFPEYWDDHTEEDGHLKLVLLSPLSDEYCRVIAWFQGTLPNVTIHRVERIQNKLLWQRYLDCAKRSIQFGVVDRGKKLFHGTRSNDPKEIYGGDSSFDMRFSNNGLWGQGNYFAVNASYSHNYAHTAGPYKQMLVATVLTGLSYYSQPSPYRKPPWCSTAGGINRRYDSVYGDTGGSRVYITYDNERAYPMYLITYA
ncbi:PREDICTED: sacsin-like [Amphimedon queenslandica]|nr:PREDICTED: sacsin-like [Amphimedon queenslandica]|eukprot:XP_011402901.2 PREDICTED: sacsin-like [Amphimedon queenslandica]